jgi:hypothetical protein
MEWLIAFSFDQTVAHQIFVALLGDENTHKAHHVKQSGQYTLSTIFDRDVTQSFQAGIDNQSSRFCSPVVFKE